MKTILMLLTVCVGLSNMAIQKSVMAMKVHISVRFVFVPTILIGITGTL